MGAPSRRFAFFRQRLTHALTLKLGLGDGDRAMLNFAPSSLRSGFFTRSACFPSSSSLFVSSYRGVALQFPKGKREGVNPKQPLITCIPYTGLAHAFSLSLERLLYKILGQGGERRIAPSNIPILDPTFPFSGKVGELTHRSGLVSPQSQRLHLRELLAWRPWFRPSPALLVASSSSTGRRPSPRARRGLMRRE